LQETLFDPLGMVDTGFFVTPEQAQRVVTVHAYDESGRLIIAQEQRGDPTERPHFLSGSGGLFSTAIDYWRFAQMVANGGEFEGRRYLEASTVELMRTNVLDAGVGVDLYGPATPGLGFGLDFAVILDPEAAGAAQGRNTFYWGGFFGTWFWIDPTNDLVFVGMIQNEDGSNPYRGTPLTREISSRAVYSAIQSKR